MLFNKSKMPVENREDVNPGVRESLRNQSDRTTKCYDDGVSKFLYAS
jgi:hypothetical protein